MRRVAVLLRPEGNPVINGGAARLRPYEDPAGTDAVFSSASLCCIRVHSCPFVVAHPQKPVSWCPHTGCRSDRSTGLFDFQEPRVKSGTSIDRERFATDSSESSPTEVHAAPS